MSKKLDLILISGFLSSGKSRLIDYLFYDLQIPKSYDRQFRESAKEQTKLASKPRIVYLSFELGNYEPKIKQQAAYYQVAKESSLSYHLDEVLKINEENPFDFLIIEYNGTYELSDLYRSLNERKIIRLKKHLNVVEPYMFFPLVRDIGAGLLQNANEADLNIYLGETKEDFQEEWQNSGIKSKLLNINLDSQTPSKKKEKIIKKVMETSLPLVKIGYVFSFLWAILLCQYYLSLPANEKVLEQVKNFLISSSSLLLQIIPFLLLSACISSCLQFFVSDQRMRKIAAAPSYLALPAIFLSGFFLPICDCGLLPITTRLAKKGLSHAKAMLIFTASCVTNPLVIASTFFAFPTQYKLVAWRLCLGLIISMLIYIIQLLWQNKLSAFCITKIKELYCPSSFGLDINSYIKQFSQARILKQDERKIKRRTFLLALLAHISSEFLIVLKPVIIGSLVCSAINSFLPGFIMYIKGQPLLIFIFLALASVFLALCASANAFVAQGFLQAISLPLLLVYMLFSPLLDLKNLLIIKQGYGKRYLIFYLMMVGVLFTLFFLLISYFLPHDFFGGQIFTF